MGFVLQLSLQILVVIGSLVLAENPKEIVALHENEEDLSKSFNKSDNTPRYLNLQTRENKTDDDSDLLSWKAPYEMRKKYPYYQAGFDYENRPVWVLEAGKWDFRSIIEAGDKTTAIFDKYIKQISVRIAKSYQTGTEEDSVGGVTLICDMDEFSLTQLAHLPTASHILQIIHTHRKWFPEHVELVFCINTNVVAHSLVNMIRPILGSAFATIEVYGTQKSKWQPLILKHIPRDQLPPWYGGPTSWQPVKIFG